MQLRLDAADRLVELVEERRGPVVADEAARRLFALRQAPVALARSLLADVVEADARLAWNGDAVGLARPLGADLLLEEASYVVVDLETTGLRPGSSQICEIGAVLVQGFEVVDEFETLVDPRVPLGRDDLGADGAHRPAAARCAAGRRPRCGSFLAFAGDSVLVAHNARFDLAFLDRETERLTGSRLAAPVVDTVALARRLLAGRVPRASLAQLSYFFGTSVQPCHRALPDAQATAEVLLALIGLAQERGARTVAELVALVGDEDAARVGQARSSRTARRRARASTSSTTATSSCSTSAAHGTCVRGCARTSAPSGNGPRWRRRSARWHGSNGACSAPSSKRRWRSCA